MGLGDGKITLSAPYLTMGSSDLVAQYSNPYPQTGLATLDVEAGRLLSLVGDLDLNGFASARLASAGDFRLVGIQAAGATTWTGQSVSAAPLTPCCSSRSYPVTLTQYGITVAPSDGSVGVAVHSKASPVRQRPSIPPPVG
jgi:hypothetical protein